MDEFLAKVAAVLEPPSVSLDTDFRALDGWCSLKAFGLLVMLEQDYGKTLPIEEFMSVHAVSDLAALIGLA